MTYTLMTGIGGRRAAYRGTQDGSQRRKRHPGGTEFWLGWMARWARERAANERACTIGVHGSLADTHRGDIRCCY
jgi:hypothetical protein